MRKDPTPPRSTDPAAYSVLIVDDEPTTLTVVAAALRDAKFTVYEAVDGEQGLAISKDKHPDLILLDLQMPKMDGITMLKELRKDAWGQDAFVMLLTHLTGLDRVAEALSLGAFDYLQKADWDLPKIVAQVKLRLRVE